MFGVSVLGMNNRKEWTVSLCLPFKTFTWCFHTVSYVWTNVSVYFTLRWRHNDHAGVSNHQPHGCLLNRLFRRKSKKTSKLRVTGLCAGNSPGTGEFPAQMASYAENVSIWWRHHDHFCMTVVTYILYDLSIFYHRNVFFRCTLLCLTGPQCCTECFYPV